MILIQWGTLRLGQTLTRPLRWGSVPLTLPTIASWGTRLTDLAPSAHFSKSL